MEGQVQPQPGPASASMSAGDGPVRQPAADAAEERLLEALQGGDEAAFSRLVDLHHASMVRVARFYVATQAAAEEVAQEAWLGVLEGLARFEGRCTVKAWIFAIVANRARTRGARDKRTVPLSALAADGDGDRPSVDPDRFLAESHPRWPGHWAQPPEAWGGDALESRETLQAIATAMQALPPMQRAVMTMRDVEGLDGGETCQVLGISEGNQRVLLHRARSKVREALESYLREGEVSP